jgi:hypothetical protein
LVPSLGKISTGGYKNHATERLPKIVRENLLRQKWDCVFLEKSRSLKRLQPYRPIVLSRLFTGAGAVATSSFFGADDLLVSVELATTGFGLQVISGWERDASWG